MKKDRYLKFFDNEVDMDFYDPIPDEVKKWLSEDTIRDEDCYISEEYADQIGPVGPKDYLVWTGEYHGDTIDVSLHKIVAHNIFQCQFCTYKWASDYYVPHDRHETFVNGKWTHEVEAEKAARGRQRQLDYVTKYQTVESQCKEKASDY